MKALKIIILIVVVTVGLGSTIYNKPTSGYYKPIDGIERSSEQRQEEIQKYVLKQAEDFHVFIRDSLKPAVEKAEVREEDLQERFLKARILYKKYEWAAEYFVGTLAERINGPPDQEVENADLMDPSMSYAINPTGLQIIEEFIFPEYNRVQKKELLEEVETLRKNAGYLVSYFRNESLYDWRILDAAKLEIFRIIALGITGFDNPLTLNSMKESAASLKSLRKVLRYYIDKRKDGSLLETIDSAIDYLEGNTDFDSFDRALFITEYANKISTGIAGMEKGLPGERIHYNRMLKQQARTLFDSTAFNVNAFAPGAKYHLTEAKAQLGERLFNDPNLSGDGSRSCFTCHSPNLGFADGMSTNTFIYNQNKHLPRNTPTLLNAALQSNYFYDMRVLTLEDQVFDVIQNSEEMDGDFEEITKYLNENPTYQKLFKKAFSSKKTEKGIEPFQIANALSSYVRSLTKLNSRFDDYMRGEKEALNEKEVDGFNLFMGKAKCATCHFVPLFNGTTPPKYLESEAEVIGVPLSKTNFIIDTDKGWYETVGVDSYKYAFKTPTVRNITQTAPYMHNGIYKTLEEVMEFYNNAGAIGLGIEIENMTLPEESLHLSEKEIDHLIKFMESLDDQFNYHNECFERDCKKHQKTDQ